MEASCFFCSFYLSNGFHRRDSRGPVVAAGNHKQTNDGNDKQRSLPRRKPLNNQRQKP